MTTTVLLLVNSISTATIISNKRLTATNKNVISLNVLIKFSTLQARFALEKAFS